MAIMSSSIAADLGYGRASVTDGEPQPDPAGRKGDASLSEHAARRAGLRAGVFVGLGAVPLRARGHEVAGLANSRYRPIGQME